MMKNKIKQLLGGMALLLIIVTAVSCTSETSTEAVETSMAEEAEETTSEKMVDEVTEAMLLEEETTVSEEMATEEETTGSEAIVAEEDYGAKGAEARSEFTLEEMFAYAIEDEYLALAEYELITSELDVTRPFTNIIEAEKTHISLLEDIYAVYEFVIPSVDPSAHTLLPDSVNEAYSAGVEAEIANIAMYELFLEQDLPDDVRSVFEALKKGSESHLLAFEKNVR